MAGVHLRGGRLYPRHSWVWESVDFGGTMCGSFSQCGSKGLRVRGSQRGRFGSTEREEGDGFLEDGMVSAGAWKRGNVDSRKKSLIWRAGKLGTEVEASARGLVSNAALGTRNHEGNGQFGWESCSSGNWNCRRQGVSLLHSGCRFTQGELTHRNLLEKRQCCGRRGLQWGRLVALKLRVLILVPGKVEVQ